jgi:choline dehydrogenase
MCSSTLNTNVVKLNFKGTRCVGVKLMTDGAVKDIAADKEVILAAGAINSPKLLMLSGVGEAKALRSLGIDVDSLMQHFRLRIAMS